MYIRCTDSLNWQKILITFDSLNVQNCVISTENYVRKMYKLSEFVKKKKLNTLNVQNYINSTKNYVHQMYRLFGFVQKFIYIGYIEFIELCKFD